jgi:hypothetical protein
VPYLKQAVAIDPEFALAYGQLGIFYEDLGESLLATTSTAMAFQLLPGQGLPGKIDMYAAGLERSDADHSVDSREHVSGGRWQE